MFSFEVLLYWFTFIGISVGKMMTGHQLNVYSEMGADESNSRIELMIFDCCYQFSPSHSRHPIFMSKLCQYVQRRYAHKTLVYPNILCWNVRVECVWLFWNHKSLSEEVQLSQSTSDEHVFGVVGFDNLKWCRVFIIQSIVLLVR